MPCGKFMELLGHGGPRVERWSKPTVVVSPSDPGESGVTPRGGTCHAWRHRGRGRQGDGYRPPLWRAKASAWPDPTTSNC